MRLSLVALLAASFLVSATGLFPLASSSNSAPTLKRALTERPELEPGTPVHFSDGAHFGHVVGHQAGYWQLRPDPDLGLSTKLLSVPEAPGAAWIDDGVVQLGTTLDDLRIAMRAGLQPELSLIHQPVN